MRFTVLNSLRSLCHVHIAHRERKISLSSGAGTCPAKTEPSGPALTSTACRVSSSASCVNATCSARAILRHHECKLLEAAILPVIVGAKDVVQSAIRLSTTGCVLCVDRGTFIPQTSAAIVDRHHQSCLSPYIDRKLPMFSSAAQAPHHSVAL